MGCGSSEPEKTQEQRDSESSLDPVTSSIVSPKKPSNPIQALDPNYLYSQAKRAQKLKDSGGPVPNLEEPIQILKDAFDGAIEHLDKLEEQTYKLVTLILQLMRDAMTAWTQDDFTYDIPFRKAESAAREAGFTLRDGGYSESRSSSGSSKSSSRSKSSSGSRSSSGSQLVAKQEPMIKAAPPISSVVDPVFLYSEAKKAQEIKDRGQVDDACKVLKDTFDGAIMNMDNLSEDSFRNVSLIMQVMRDGLTQWTNGDVSYDLPLGNVEAMLNISSGTMASESFDAPPTYEQSTRQ